MSSAQSADARHAAAGHRPPPGHTSWRPDIQGLRAIAVLSVLLFHLGVAPFGGGFVGVDVFFVISGYLISQGIFLETAQGRFSLPRFYERRARRLLPVFLVTAIGTTALAYAVLFPPEFVAYAKTLIAGSLFAANIYFYATHNYFGPSPDSIPLLHLWSLGVEEQFYLLFPLLALWGARLTARSRLAGLAGLALVSFAASAAMTHAHPTAAFYLLPFRAFEFLIGSYLALPETRPPPSAGAAALAGWTGLVALAGSILGFRTSMDFPGAWAAIPCLAAGLLIWAGAGRRAAPTRLLSVRPLTFFGNISYSLYMVHWPMIVIAGQLPPLTPPALRAAVLFAAPVLLSTVLLYLVEEPVRRARSWRGPAFLAGSAAALAAVAMLGFGIVRAAGFPGRLEARTAGYLAYLGYNSGAAVRSRACFLDPEQGPAQYDPAVCMPAPGPAQKLVVLWGDSVAAHLYPGLRDALAPHGVVLGQATASACPPTIGYDAPQRPLCESFNDRALAAMLERKPALVLMSSSWGDPAALDHVEGPIRTLRAASIPVVLVGPAAYYREPVPRILSRRLASAVHGTTAQNDMMEFVGPSEARVRALAAKAGVLFVSILQAYCPAGQCPLLTDTGVPVEFDPLHFTVEGSRFVAAKMVPALLGRI